MDVKAGMADAAPAAPPGNPPQSDTSPGAETLPGPLLRPRTKAQQRETTTAALIDAARGLFAQKGYAGVGTEEIVQRAGVTRGALYHHFRGGKEELFQAVLVQVSAETSRRIAERAVSAADPWEALTVGIDAFLESCTAPEIQRIVLVDGPSVLGWDLWRAIDAEHGLGLLEFAVKRAIDAGQLAPAPAKAVAHVLLGALDEAAMVVARAEDPQSARAEMSETLRRLLEGLRGPRI
jgi:AcrR family transcriptional regulator